MGANFPPSLLAIRGLALVFHYQELTPLYDGVPLVMAYGLPVSGKSLAIQIAMALLEKIKALEVSVIFANQSLHFQMQTV